MNRFLKNKKGVTLLEGLIAIGLLAMVSVSTFSVLLSISRRAKQPDLREEMLLAVERAQDGLLGDARQDLLNGTQPVCVYNNSIYNDPHPLLANSPHDMAIKCLLPRKCDTSSTFGYTLNPDSLETKIENLMQAEDIRPMYSQVTKDMVFGIKKIQYEMNCTGRVL